MNTISNIIIRPLRYADYSSIWQAMRVFTDSRNAETTDEIWLIEHPPIYTLGQAGKQEHILNPGTIPIINVDRGGQVTYHGPGQLVVYFMLDIKRLGLGVRELVTHLENAIIQLLADYKITATAKRDAPGVYVDGAKICSIGLRIRRGCSYHGLAFNINMDLSPFNGINPCGYAKLPVTQLSAFVNAIKIIDVIPNLLKHLLNNLKYQNIDKKMDKKMIDAIEKIRTD